MQIIGFVLIVFGNLIYNGIIVEIRFDDDRKEFNYVQQRLTVDES